MRQFEKRESVFRAVPNQSASGMFRSGDAQLQASAANSLHARKLNSLQSAADNSVAQRYALKDYDIHKDYLPGEDCLRSTERVDQMIDILKEGGEIEEGKDGPIESASVELVEDEDSLDAGYINVEELEEDDKAQQKPVKAAVLVNGHHRYVAHVEAMVKMPRIVESNKHVVSAYKWRSMGGIEHDYLPPAKRASEKSKTDLLGDFSQPFYGTSAPAGNESPPKEKEKEKPKFKNFRDMMDRGFTKPYYDN